MPRSFRPDRPDSLIRSTSSATSLFPIGAGHGSLGDLTPAEFKKQMGTTHGGLGESLTGVILQ